MTSALSNTEIFNQCVQLQQAIYNGISHNDYPELSLKDFKVKIFKTILRIEMYIATNITDETYYSYSLDQHLADKNRKKLVKILECLESLTLTMVNNFWYDQGSSLFYKQKDNLAINRKLSAICIIARDNNGFVNVENNILTIVKNISQATEFIAHTDDAAFADLIQDKLNSQFEKNDIKAFFNKKIDGRHSVNLCTSL